MGQGLMSGLIEVGLTSNQAKVYLTLVQQKSAPAVTISKVSKIARAEVYRILASLSDLQQNASFKLPFLPAIVRLEFHSA